jgi:hypothetical protein
LTARAGSRRWQALLRGYAAEHVFNPWSQGNADDVSPDAAAARRRRLAAHLRTRAEYVLIGEASGYQGCRMSGIPFTSERLVIAGSIPRVTCGGQRLSTRARPWSEPSATVVWSTLHELGIAERTVLWNAFPWHPHRPQQPLSNRTPLPAERALGLAVLAGLLAQFPHAQVFAVGRHAELSLHEIGQPATALRHPSMGGAARFRQSLRAAVLER